MDDTFGIECRIDDVFLKSGHFPGNGILVFRFRFRTGIDLVRFVANRLFVGVHHQILFQSLSSETMHEMVWLCDLMMASPALLDNSSDLG